MNDSLQLAITSRTKTSKGEMKRLRKEGLLTGSLSQRGGESVSFYLKRDEFRKALNANGKSSVYSLRLDQKTAYPAMVHEIQYAPGFGDFLHVTFQRVSLTEETTADIPVHIKGREELVRHNHELMQQMETVRLKGLPGDFPAGVEIDVSQMKPGDTVAVADLKLPEGVVCVTEADRLVVSVPHPKLAAQEPAETDAATDAEPAKPAEGGAE